MIPKPICPSTRASISVSPAAAFTSSDADYTVEFEPFATTLELEGSGYVVASLGTESGYVPYTAYCAEKELYGRKSGARSKIYKRHPARH